MKLTVSDIQRFCMHDGDGLRTTVFLKGCPLRCKWCHNPETQNAKPEMLFYKCKCIGCGSCSVCPNGAQVLGDTHSFDYQKCAVCGSCANVCPTKAMELNGKEMDADEIIKAVMADIAFYGDNGGVTFSGGEPTAQAEGLVYLLKRFKEAGINTAVETCGYFDEKYLHELVKYTDIFLWDIKDTDNERHKENTGVSNRRIIENLLAADGMGARTVLRCIVIKGLNDSESHYRKIGEIYSKLKNCDHVELLPYHTYGGTKHEALRGFDNGAVEWVPEKDDLEFAKKILSDLGVDIR